MNVGSANERETEGKVNRQPKEQARLREYSCVEFLLLLSVLFDRRSPCWWVLRHTNRICVEWGCFGYRLQYSTHSFQRVCESTLCRNVVLGEPRFTLQ